ncbi:CatB-related O-acetyltransferase [Paenibacillus popilliae]|uniref:CatB-related O-acetyltransferase n=1 Tax=Paenibacillus popilliae TaxID=78057 RepID=A0ABY3AQJ0_PAEPP|nr:CatB-related O-acetyltransferase [Paenibacillus sp. SDF0028]TQR44852.1 CatB-related O-acetyltransferase [Paenibacillus sp. SDF0028]
MSYFLNQNPAYQQYQIGDWSYGYPNVLTWGEKATLTIGKFCSFASNTTIMLGGEHNVDWVTTYPFNPIFPNAAAFLGHPKTKGDVTIGHDVWIGFDSLILSGVSIGNGAVIAAKSIVTKNIPAYAIAGGNPARVIRYRFPPSIIDDLQRIAWWDWPLEYITVAWPLLLSNRIEDFIRTYKTW